MFVAVLDDIPPVLTPTGRRCRWPGKVHADKRNEIHDQRGSTGRLPASRFCDGRTTRSLTTAIGIGRYPTGIDM
jgi:hypothetical protein